MKVQPTESYRGKRSIDCPAQRNRYNPLPASEQRDLWGVGAAYGRMLTCPLRFDAWAIREMHASKRRTRQALLSKRIVRSAVRTRVLDDVEREGVTY